MATGTTIGGRTALLRAAHDELAEHGHADISLRAVARRAGVSHAAPKYHFEDRRGLLTAVAVEGFEAFATALRAPGEDGGALPRLTRLGHAYVDFGLANGPLFDLMWRPSELHTEDDALRRAQDEAFAILASAIADYAGGGLSEEDVTDLATMAWAEVHGLVLLIRDGALGRGRDAVDSDALAWRVMDLFARLLGSAWLEPPPLRGPT